MARKIVLVVWEDIYLESGTLQVDEDVIPHLFESVGFVKQDDDSYVVLAVDWDTKNEEWRSYQVIPRGVIKSVTYLN